MRRIVFVVVCLVVLAGLVVPLVLVTMLRNEQLETFEKHRANLEAKQRLVGARVMADHRRWVNDPLFARRDGGDAAPLLNETIGWAITQAKRGLNPAVEAALKDAGAEWPQLQLDVSGIDLSWMKELHTYGYWDLESEGPLRDAPFDGLKDETPSGMALQNTAKVRLLQGIASGQVDEARAEVRELARLSFSAETLITDMLGVALLTVEHRGTDAGFSQAEIDSLRSALWAAEHSTALSSPVAPLDADFPLIGKCSALHEATMAIMLRPWVHDTVPERYAAIDTLLAKSPECRLRRFRRAWASDAGEGELPVDEQALCTMSAGTASSRCDVPSVVLKIPGVRRAMGATMLTISTTDWLVRYQLDGGTPP